jgi:hypothetical protein
MKIPWKNPADAPVEHALAPVVVAPDAPLEEDDAAGEEAVGGLLSRGFMQLLDPNFAKEAHERARAIGLPSRTHGLMVAVSENDSDDEDDDNATVTPADVTQVHPNRVFRRR